MNKVKSIGFTALISILFVGVLHIIPINKKQREKDELAKNVPIEEDLEFRDSHFGRPANYRRGSKCRTTSAFAFGNS